MSNVSEKTPRNHDRLTSPFARQFNCTLTGNWLVTQGAVEYCEQWGHGFYEIENTVQDWCPRCGETINPNPNEGK